MEPIRSLPFGWYEQPVKGHPYDVPEGEDHEKILDKDGETVVGRQRYEVKRWKRGARVVRICWYYVEQTYKVYGMRAKAKYAETLVGSGNATLAEAYREAWEEMAKGGRT